MAFDHPTQKTFVPESGAEEMLQDLSGFLMQVEAILNYSKAHKLPPRLRKQIDLVSSNLPAMKWNIIRIHGLITEGVITIDQAIESARALKESISRFDFVSH